MTRTTGILHRVRGMAFAVLPLSLLLCLTPPAGPALAVELTPREIVENVVELDGITVTVTGEVIGDRLRADGDHVWLNILGEDGLAIGVYVVSDIAAAVEVFGDYSHKGDLVRVQGVVNSACDDHGGDLDVHASSLEIVSEGHEIEHEAEPLIGALGLALIATAAVLSRVYRRRRLIVGYQR